MPSLPAPIRAFIVAAVSALGGGVFALITTRLPWLHVSRDTVTTDILVGVGAGITWLEHRPWLDALVNHAIRLLHSRPLQAAVGEIKRFAPGLTVTEIETLLESRLGPLLAKLEELIGLHDPQPQPPAKAASSRTRSTNSGAK